MLQTAQQFFYKYVEALTNVVEANFQGLVTAKRGFRRQIKEER
jgi:hypothetical protein